MKKLIFLLILVCGLLNSICAQSNAPIRLEFESKKDNQDYQFEIGGNSGVLVYYKSHFSGKDSVNWVLLQYDTNLTKQKLSNLKLHNLAVPIASCNDSSVIYLLFKQWAAKNIPIRWFVIQYNLSSKKYSVIQLPIDVDDISYIKALDNRLFCVVNDDKYSDFFSVDLRNLQIYRLPNNGQSLKCTHFLEINPLNQMVYAAFQYTDNTKSDFDNAIFLSESDFSFQNASISTFPNYTDCQLNNARCVVTDSNSILLLGSYFFNAEGTNKNYLHTGFYSVPYSNSKFGEMHYYKISSLNSDKSNSDNSDHIQNQDKLFVVGKAYGNGEQFALVAESYNPEYSQYYNTPSMDYSLGYYDRMMPGSTFIGYRFDFSYVTAFDKNGNLLWNNKLPFNNVMTRSLYPKTGVYLDQENNGLIYYNFSNKITSILVHDYDILEPIYTQDLETSYPNDEVEYTQNLQIVQWYKQYFLISGYQYIKNIARDKQKKRFVFSLNKLEYQ